MNEGEPHPHPTNEHSIGSSALLRDLLRSSSRRGYVSFSLFAVVSLFFKSQDYKSRIILGEFISLFSPIIVTGSVVYM